MDQILREQLIETAIAAGIVVTGVAIAWLVASLLRRIVRFYTRGTETEIDDQLVDAVRGPLLLFVVLVAVRIALETLSYLDPERATIATTWNAAALVVGVIVVQRISAVLVTWGGQVIARRSGTDWDVKSLPLIRRLLNVAIFTIGILVVLGELGLSISPLLAGLGIGGLALALALQPLLTNVFASSYMLSDASIRVGDFIEISGGPTGWVEDIGFRATRIRTFDNNIIIIPNSTLADATVTNFDTAGAPVDAAITCGVAYEADLTRVEEVCIDELRSIIADFDEAVEGDPVFRFQNFGDSNIDFLMKVRASTRRQVGLLRHEMIKRIHARLAREGITINYPARRLFLEPADTVGLERLAAGSPTRE